MTTTVTRTTDEVAKICEQARGFRRFDLVRPETGQYDRKGYSSRLTEEGKTAIIHPGGDERDTEFFALEDFIERGWEVENHCPVDLIERTTHCHLSGIMDSLRNRGCLFTDRGAMRLQYTVGWLRGMHDAGKQTEAYQLHDWFISVLLRLTGHRKRSKWSESSSFATNESYVVYGDDGCDHSFTFRFFTRADHSRYCEMFAKRREENPDAGWFDSERQLKKDLQALEHPELYDDAVYIPMFHGGLIYHGGNETFACRLESDANPWSTHT